MARERMVTRTVNEYEVTTLCVNVKTTECGYNTVRISGTIPTEKILSYIQKHFDDENVKTVSIVGTVSRETLYGMPEAEFIKLAKVLPPRTGNTEE